MAKRGLASADAATRRRVASEGGKASHGGGRGKKGGSASQRGFAAISSDKQREIARKSSSS